MITDKVGAQKLQQSTYAGFQSKTQTTSVSLNQNKNNTETTESIPFTEVTGFSNPTTSTRKPGFKKPLQDTTEPFEAILIFILIQMHLKSLHSKIFLLV